jgi:hypothetical protein
MLWRLVAAPAHAPPQPEAAPPPTLPSRAWRPQGGGTLTGNAAAWRNHGTQARRLEQNPNP